MWFLFFQSTMNYLRATNPKHDPHLLCYVRIWGPRNENQQSTILLQHDWPHLRCVLRHLCCGRFTQSTTLGSAGIVFRLPRNNCFLELQIIPWGCFFSCLASLFRYIVFLCKWLSLSYCLHLSSSFSYTFTISLYLFSSAFSHYLSRLLLLSVQL